MNRLSQMFFLPAVIVFLLSCAGNDVERAMESIKAEDMVTCVREFGSDRFLGRKPFTMGERIAVDYLVEQFRRLGLEPGFGESYTQDVPMVEVTISPDEEMVFRTGVSGSGPFSLRYRDDFVVFSRRMVELSLVEDVPLVFAGYGIVAPEYGWDDYRGIDARGKIVMVLVNDPGYATGDPTLFRGNDMTYYGRWTYKYEEAARQGALGLMIVHEEGAAGYSWSVVHNGAVIPKLYLVDQGGYAERCAIEGWFTGEAAKTLVSGAGFHPDSLFGQAARRDFRAADLGITVSYALRRSFRYDSSVNVMGMIRGTERPDECIIYSAHWDHLGVGDPENGDSIYNGAVDNGTSLAWMLAIARAFMSLDQGPGRTILFLSPTAEEQGLLGADYYVRNPVIPVHKTVANINNDLMLPIGRMKDVMITGFGQSELEDIVKKYAARQDRHIVPDPNPHTGMYFRADHFSFARAGIPSLFARGNCEHRMYGKAYADSMEQDYIRNRYHRPADEYDPATWDLEGIAEDSRLLFLVGYELARGDAYPKWKEGSEFRTIREGSGIRQ